MVNLKIKQNYMSGICLYGRQQNFYTNKVIVTFWSVIPSSQLKILTVI